MALLIQDDIIRRALNFLGLRGVVQHQYEPTIMPLVQIGDLGQPTQLKQDTNRPLSSFAFTVPIGEVWRPLLLCGQYNQTGGTVAPTRVVVEAISPDVTVHMRFPWIMGTGQAEAMEQTPNLNGANLNYTVYFWPGIFIPQGWSIQYVAAGVTGDGTIRFNTQSLLINRISEGLVLLE